MDTCNKIVFSNAEKLESLQDDSVDLVVTSPPYPMIEMWDSSFSEWEEEIKTSLSENNGNKAFELMHQKLDLIWEECNRVLKDGCFACINIGDATRKVGDQFKLYSNHTRITEKFYNLGFDCLPIVLWRKQTNAPNKFMGSGMLPSGAYVTLEHEYILIFRKGNKRTFKNNEKENRQESAYFWEERNIWFSDIWDFKGTNQNINNAKSRKRSGAYPIELAHRLINMYSMKNDYVLDPFIGTGTTLNACILNKRNCIGYEIDSSFKNVILENVNEFSKEVNDIIGLRYKKHQDFIESYIKKKGNPKYFNKFHNFPVVTNQETNLILEILKNIIIQNTEFKCSYTQFGGV